MNGCKPNFLFVVRCLEKEAPILMIFFNILFSTAFFGYGFRIWDRHLSSNPRWTNEPWVAIITMTTVGYGDRYPISGPAKLLGVLCAFWGVYITSLFTNTMTDFLVFNEA